MNFTTNLTEDLENRVAGAPLWYGSQQKRSSIYGFLTGLNVQIGRMSTDTGDTFTDDSFGQCRQLRFRVS